MLLIPTGGFRGGPWGWGLRLHAVSAPPLLANPLHQVGRLDPDWMLSARLRLRSHATSKRYLDHHTLDQVNGIVLQPLAGKLQNTFA